MGLDMYLEKRVYVKNWDHMRPEERTNVTVTRGGKVVPSSEINPEKIKYVIEEAGYWRKANAIHAWFVHRVQEDTDDCGYHYVSHEDLQALLDTVKRVLEGRDAVAQELLPTQSGFFFGSTDYDEYYYDDLEETVRILEAALAATSGEFYYHSSW